MVSTVKSRPNHYQTLGIAPTATGDEIAQAFTRELRRPRPFGGLAQVGLAYETLRDPAKRQAYDRSIGLSPEPPPLQWTVAKPRWSGTSFIGSAPAASPEPRAAEPLPSPVVSAEPEPQPEPRTAPFIASSLRDLAAPGVFEKPVAPVRQAEAPRRPEPLARPEPDFAIEEDLPEAGQDAIDWRRPALAAGALVLAVGLLGAWAGSEAGNDIEQKAAEQAVTLAVPPAKAQPAETREQPAVAVSNAAEVRPEPPRPVAVAQAPAERRPIPKPLDLTLSEQQALASQAEALQSEQGAPEQIPAAQDLAESPVAPVTQARLPLPNSVIARTIGRIGYACGSVASTTAVDGGAPGVFKVTCTSGHSYRAAPVRGRYHFRRWGRD